MPRSLNKEQQTKHTEKGNLLFENKWTSSPLHLLENKSIHYIINLNTRNDWGDA